jgi:hypothetical protein
LTYDCWARSYGINATPGFAVLLIVALTGRRHLEAEAGVLDGEQFPHDGRQSVGLDSASQRIARMPPIAPAQRVFLSADIALRTMTKRRPVRQPHRLQRGGGPDRGGVRVPVGPGADDESDEATSELAGRLWR